MANLPPPAGPFKIARLKQPILLLRDEEPALFAMVFLNPKGDPPKFLIASHRHNIAGLQVCLPGPQPALNSQCSPGRIRRLDADCAKDTIRSQSLKGVFEISGNSRYDDEITERYHFPNNYLPIARQLVGDWIIYRETRAAGGRMAYTGTALLRQIDPDHDDAGHSYARMSDYLDFDRPVPYRDGNGRFAERLLREMVRASDAGRTLQGKSIRLLDNTDFAAIVRAGLADTLDPHNRIRLELDPPRVDTETELLLSDDAFDRRVEQILVNRKIRNANFRNHVLAAYDNTCAVTGLRIVNGGGKAEAQAAHIWSVADGGPDIVQNGVALSATAHWLFDRHLITFDDDLCLIVSHNKVPEQFRQLFPPAGSRIRLPADTADHPRPDFVARHREVFANKALN